MSESPEKRTLLQNKAMHKYFSMLSEALNEAGYDMKKTLKPEIDIPWTPAMIKEHLWRPIQLAMTNKTSTTEQQTIDVSAVYETLNRHTSTKLGVSVGFPDRFGDK